MSATQDHQPIALKCPQCGANLPHTSEGYLVCQYCGTSLVLPQADRPTGQGEVPVIRGIRLKPLTYTDSQGTGLELFRMLVPVGWQFQGGCRWVLDNPGMPAAVSIQVWNPQGAEAFEVLPNMNFIWNTNPMARPLGPRYFGAEVRPPLPVLEALRTLVLPRYRSAVEKLSLLHAEVLPDLPQQVRSEAPVSGGSAEGGKVRIQYTWKGWQFEEEIYGVVEIFRAPIASMFGPSEVLIWFVDYLFSFRTAPGRMDATAGLFKVMIGSFRLNPHWYAAYKSIVQTLAQQQIQRIRHIGQIGQMIAQTGREIREQNLRDWYAKQAIYEQHNTEWSRMIRGVDAFLDPHRQEVVELPSGYGHAWANNLGEYILTEDPNFNPNLSSNLHWEPMQQQ